MSHAAMQIGSMSELVHQIDRRVAERIPARFPIQMRHGGHDLEAVLLDLSHDGARCAIAGAPPLAVGDAVELDIPATGTGPERSYEAHIVRVNHRGESIEIGVKFDLVAAAPA